MAATGSGNVEFIRARSDKREYRRVALANALEVLVISDPDADKVCRSVAISGRPPFGMVANLSLSRYAQAAACMEVEVGSFSDPEGLEGLAHFLGEFVSSPPHPVRWLPAL